MEKRTVNKIEIVLEEHEARIVMHCLNYTAGRLKKGKASGIKQFIRPAKIDSMREMLREIFG